jgi:hypothetical protein
MPQVAPPKDPAQSPNILFFGAFTKMSEAEYIATILATAADSRTVFESFARDIYQNGQVLAGKKYLLLGYAYRVLLCGLVASAITFAAPYLLRVL